MAATFTLRIVCPQGEFYNGEAEIVNVVSTTGQLGILANMIPFAAVLEISPMNFVADGQRQYFFVSGGFIHVTGQVVTIITDAIENKDNIDLERAQRAMERARKRLESHSADVDIMRAELALKRAITRIHVKNL